MIQRTTNPNVKQTKDYMGRGITVCERWRKFENFLADMGERPPGLTLERINNDGNYEPGNCMWATREAQQKNRRGALLMRLTPPVLEALKNKTDWKCGEKQKVAAELGIHRSTLSKILHSKGAA